MSERNHSLTPGPSESFTSFTETDALQPPPEPPRGFREGLPPAFRMRADAHYVEQLDAPAPAVTILKNSASVKGLGGIKAVTVYLLDASFKNSASVS